MTQTLLRAGHSVREQAARWFRKRAEECMTCRDCDAKVAPWDDCCSNCGRGNPARVSTSAGFAVAIVCGLALIAVLAIADF